MYKKKKEIINFYVPVELKNRFDSICAEINQTRTSILLSLMDRFVVQKGLELAETSNHLNTIDNHIAERRKVMGFREFVEQQDQILPPGFFPFEDQTTDF